jgi:hypothetical protein
VSDFFTDLAARARDAEVAVRPRTATRFEPVAETPRLTEVATETESVVVQASSEASELPATTERTEPADQARREALHRAPAQSTPQPAAEPAARLERPLTPDRSAPQILLRPPLPAVAGAPDAERIGDATPPLVLPEPAAPAPVGIRGAMNAETALSRTVAPSRPEPAAPHETVRSIVATPVPTQPLPVPVPFQREVRAARASRLPPAEREAQPPAETVVHVSIGRIELRAPPAAPSRKREQAVSPVMTLADYLRNRAGRARP